jgi:hypothetical protein
MSYKTRCYLPTFLPTSRAPFLGGTEIALAEIDGPDVKLGDAAIAPVPPRRLSAGGSRNHGHI